MSKFLVAVALLAACASPALAGSAKVRSHHGYNGYSSYPTPDWVRPLPHSERLANALGGWNRGYPGGSLLGALPLISADLGTGRLRRRPLGSTGWV